MALKNWEFVAIRLHREDEKKVNAFGDPKDNDIQSMLSDITSHGYKVSLAWVDKQNAYVFTVSGTDNTKYNKQTSMSSWSDDLYQAVVLGAYKMEIITKWGDWQQFSTQQELWG